MSKLDQNCSKNQGSSDKDPNPHGVGMSREIGGDNVAVLCSTRKINEKDTLIHCCVSFPDLQVSQAIMLLKEVVPIFDALMLRSGLLAWPQKSLKT